MSVTRKSAASRQRVWDVMADGWTYSQWVVGNSRMRAVDANWPAPGSTIRHSVGVWPAAIDDETVVEECIPGERLVLLAKFGPAGAARVTLELRDSDSGCEIEMHEVPAQGPVNLVPDKLAELAVRIRNRECTWRLAALAERLVPKELT
ncbi:SRPBCC family protein [[Mycobacterium] burgundiense]|uniref:SRPBCC family protein n=1 Tax=[Mycobacterium] burgundiense TaxID=3064286 RepID=A0ABN9NR62_9MYCO|nr:SRPBCC family protein [Mycolicibacterium sp. MU0053]CAJ1510656.1 SRPBCC family protein [Mycolicibacterium sp. MU0053]